VTTIHQAETNNGQQQRQQQRRQFRSNVLQPPPETKKKAGNSDSCHLTAQMGSNDIVNFLTIRLASSLIALIYVF